VVLSLLIFLIVIGIILCNIAIVKITSKRNSQTLEQLPICPYGIIMGTSPKTCSGYINHHYLTRIEAAVQAFNHAAISHLIISGGDIECKLILDDLIKHDIPANRISCDPEGLNTYRSLKNISCFISPGDCFIIISQRFFAYRALFIALILGLNAVAYAPAFQNPSWNMLWPLIKRGKLAVLPREWLARTKAVMKGFEVLILPSDANPYEAIPGQEPWRPIDTTKLLVSNSGNRTAKLYARVIEQFNVETHLRYSPRNNKTFCNIFVWDVTRAMHAEIPHWVDDQGRPVSMGCGRELQVNATLDWLVRADNCSGWQAYQEKTIENLKSHVRKGCPAIAIWKNPTNQSGHIAVIHPEQPDDTILYIAQAGSVNSGLVALEIGFGIKDSCDCQSKEIRFFIHD